MDLDDKVLKNLIPARRCLGGGGGGGGGFIQTLLPEREGGRVQHEINVGACTFNPDNDLHD